MAVAAGVNWYWDKATGSTNNGGGFTTGASGSNLAYPTSSPVHITGVTSAGAGNICLHASAAAAWVGNIVNVVTGTNFTTTAGAARFEITSVVVGVSFTTSTNKAGASISTGVGADGDMYVGGALDFYNSATDDALMENGSDGNNIYIKQGSYTAGAFASGDSGQLTLRHEVYGYAVSIGDNPTATTRPTITVSATWTCTTNWGFQYLMLTGSLTTAVFSAGSSSHAQIKNCKFTNTSAVSTDAAATSGANGFFDDCEFVNTSGIGLSLTFQMLVRGCRFNACRQGLLTTAAYNNIDNNIFSNCTVESIRASATSFVGAITSNTIYGGTVGVPVGVGLELVTAAGAHIRNNIFYGLVEGISHDSAGQLTCLEDYNCFFGNTTNRTNIAVGANSISTDPAFANAAGGDFTPGANVKALAWPRLFPGGLVTNYEDMGAIQRQGGTSVDPGVGNVKSGVGYTIDDAALVGTGANITTTGGQKYKYMGPN